MVSAPGAASCMTVEPSGKAATTLPINRSSCQSRLPHINTLGMVVLRQVLVLDSVVSRRAVQDGASELQVELPSYDALDSSVRSSWVGFSPRLCLPPAIATQADQDDVPGIITTPLRAWNEMVECQVPWFGILQVPAAGHAGKPTAEEMCALDERRGSKAWLVWQAHVKPPSRAGAVRLPAHGSLDV